MKRLPLFIALNTLSLLLHIPAGYSAETLNSATTSVTVNGSTKKAELSYSLPTSVVLGNSVNVIWSVNEITTTDEFGNRTENLGLDGYGNCGGRERLVSCELSGSGRTAILTLESALAVRYRVLVSAKVGQAEYTNEQIVDFLASPERRIFKYSPQSRVPSLTYQSPDVGKDLQTIVKVKVDSVYGADSQDRTRYVLGPFWTSMEVVDSKGKSVENSGNLVASANQNCIVYFQNYQLDISDRACSWINIPVTYSNWAKWGGLFVKLTWGIDGGVGQNKYARLSKTYEIPINFPKALPSIKSSCRDVYKDMESSCSIELIYKDALGSISTGPGTSVIWKLRDASGKTIASKEEPIALGKPVSVVVPQSKTGFTLESQLVGDTLKSVAEAKTAIVFAEAKPYDYSGETQRSLSIELDCPNTFKGSKLTCAISTSSLTDDSDKYPIKLQVRIDGGSWKTAKTMNLTLNDSNKFTVSATMKRTFEIRAMLSFGGKVIYSESEEWFVKQPTYSLSQIESSIRRDLIRNCNSLPSGFSKLIFSRKGQSLNYYGDIVVIYGLGSLRISVFDGGSYWRWGPVSSSDEGTLDAWNCRYPSNAPKR